MMSFGGLGYFGRGKRLLVAALAGTLFLLLMGCGNGGQLGGNQSGKRLQSIIIAPQNPSVPLGNSQQFSATAVYSDGSKVDVTSTAVWGSAQPTIATVSASGLAVSKAVGTTVVTAGSGSVAASSMLTVSTASLVSIAVTPANPTLTPKHATQLKATGTFSDGSQQDLSASVTWSSAPDSVVKVGSLGLATAQTIGTATITATSGSISGNDNITVVAPVMVSISISPNGAQIPLGETQQLTATANFDDGSTQDVTNSAAWSSSATDVIGINDSGAASAKAVGTATVTATSGQITGSDVLTVGPPILVAVEIVPATSQIALGTSQRFSAVGTLSDGTSEELADPVTWTSADPSIATINEGGVATGLQAGDTTIFASSDSISGSASLSVLPVMAVTYFANANNPQTQDLDATVRIGNPGATGGNLCAMIYVFDNDQQLTECCGCLETPNGLRTLSVNTDLVHNPLTGVKSKTGVVKIVPADAAGNPSCDPAAIVPKGEIAAWSTNIQKVSTGVFALTETQFQLTPLGDTELSALQNQCSFLNTLGSGHGICTCGTGD
jgi:hypothetical protein